MKEFHPTMFTDISWLLSAVENITRMAQENGRDVHSPVSNEHKDYLAKRLSPLQSECQRLGLIMSAKLMGALIPALSNSSFSPTDLQQSCRELRGRLQDEMELWTFFSIDGGKHSMATGNNLFGENVTQAFPSIASDIEEAARCLAFYRWTAVVFHLSRVSEIAMVSIAKRVGYESHKEGFGSVLKYMDDGLEKARKDYKNASPLFKGDIEFLSTVTAQMHAVNEAWRQHVSHLDKKYNEEEAIRIWNTTKVLMQTLSTKLGEQND